MALLGFLQDLLRIPALSGQEQTIAARVLEEMRNVGFDEAWTDGAGNAIGWCRGQEPGPACMLLTHLDHIDVGDAALWPFAPFAATFHAGAVWGRGAVDIKGPLAAHVYTVAVLRAQNQRPRHDVLVVATTWEEIGGKGAQYFCEHLPLKTPSGATLTIKHCIVAEPSGNRVMLGHRGVVRATLSAFGRAHHGSLALDKENPHFVMAEMLRRVQTHAHPTHSDLGASSIAPTVVVADTKSDNLTPNRVELQLDWRITGETENDVRAALASFCDGLNASFELRLFSPGFYTPPDHALVTQLQRHVLAHNPEAQAPGVWRFATDGRFLPKHGIAVVGFGPGDQNLAHTTQEHVRAEDLEWHTQTLSAFLMQASAWI